MNKPGLTDVCHRAIFSVEKQELQDSSLDYTLLTTCRRMIRQFCHEEDQSQALVCLKVSDYIALSVGRVHSRLSEIVSKWYHILQPFQISVLFTVMTSKLYKLNFFYDTLFCFNFTFKRLFC